MAGGEFVPGVPKVRPGFYAIMQNGKDNVNRITNKGIVLVPISLNWGPSKKFMEFEGVDLGSNLIPKLGYDITHKNLRLIREISKRASKVIIYNIQGGTTSSAKIGELTVTAKYPGDRGNDIKVIISENPAKGKNVKLFLDYRKIYEIEGVTTISELPESDWVNFEGTGEITTTSSATTLSGGTTTKATNSDIIGFLDDCETQFFRVLCFPYTDKSLLTSFNEKISYLVKRVGKQVIGVSPDNSANSNLIISVKNGVVLQNGTQIDNTISCGWVAGATASASANEDLTYQNYDGAIDVNPRFKDQQIREALQSGEFVLTLDEIGNVIVEEDINSLTTFTDKMDKSYSNNRFMRTMNEALEISKYMLKPNKYDNGPDGPSLILKDILKILLQMEKESKVKNVDPSDIIVEQDPNDDEAVVITIGMQPVKSFKKYYVTFKTR